MIIDNFDIVREHLIFEPARKFDAKTKELKLLNDTYDRYIVQILRRAKDPNGKQHGVNTEPRLIKTYELNSLEYFDMKKSLIMELCISNNARAYIHPQVRSTYDCLKEMIKIGVENLENPTIKFNHIMRSCLCRMHKSRAKRWIIDLDPDEMDGWKVEEVKKLIAQCLKKCNIDPEEIWSVPTVHGTHIITPPFDLQYAMSKCRMMFEGVKKFPYNKDVGPEEYETHYKQHTGWVHKDGMTLLYFNDGKE